MREFFAARGMAVEAIHDGRRGLARALSGEHDLILLDVMLPGLDGFEVLRQVRRRSLVPIIMLTARTARADRVAGLDAGPTITCPSRSSRRSWSPASAPSSAAPAGPRRRPGVPGSQWRPAGAGHARGLVRGHARRDHDDRVRHPRADRSARPAGSSPATSCRRRSTGARPRPRTGRSTSTSATCGRSWAISAA